MKILQKTGGFAALYQAGAYLAGMLYFLLVLEYADVSNTNEKLTIILENKVSVLMINQVIYVLFGVVLVLLVTALYERFKTMAPQLAYIANAFGLIWATLVIASGMVFNVAVLMAAELHASNLQLAQNSWAVLSTVQDGLGGSNEVVGGVWTLLVSIGGWRYNILPTKVNIIGLAAGLAGVASTIPFGADITTAVFGLIQLIWFAGLGLFLITEKSKTK